MWALAYTTARFPLSFWQIGKFRWESSSTFHCPHLNNPAQTEECSIYAQLFTGGQNPVKTPQMWIFCRKQPRLWAPEVPQLSKGGGKQGQPSVLPASPDALKSWQTVDSLFEAVLSSDQREGLLLGRQIPSKQRCRRRQGEGMEQLSVVSGAHLQLKWWEDQTSPMESFSLFLLWGFLPPPRLWIQCANIFQGSRVQITIHHGFFITTGAVSHCPILHKHFSPCYLFNYFLLH